MFKTETHLHVAEVSPCANIRAGEMVRHYNEAGYKTVFVSDHYDASKFNMLGDIPWQEKTSILMSGYYRAKEAGKKYGMNILLAAEIMFEGCGNHYLVYGITKAFMDEYPEFYKMKVEEFAEIAKAHNLFIIQAHPYRDGRNFPTPEFVDGMEVYNSNPRHDDSDEKSELVAKENGLYMIGGSDAHRLEDVGGSGILSEFEIKTTEDFISAVKSGKIEIIRKSQKGML